MGHINSIQRDLFEIEKRNECQIYHQTLKSSVHWTSNQIKCSKFVLKNKCLLLHIA